MIDLRYKFASEAEAISLLPEYRAEDEEGNAFWKTAGEGFCLDPIGTLTKVTPTEDPEAPIVEILPGFHLNLRIWDDRETPAPDKVIAPANPMRAWA